LPGVLIDVVNPIASSKLVAGGPWRLRLRQVLNSKPGRMGVWQRLVDLKAVDDPVHAVRVPPV